MSWSDDDGAEAYVPVRKRLKLDLTRAASSKLTGPLLIHEKAAAEAEKAAKTAEELEAEAEQALTAAMEAALAPVRPVHERVAEGVIEERRRALPCTWKPCSFLSSFSQKDIARLCESWGIDLEGQRWPPPLVTGWKDAKLPRPIADFIRDKGLHQPSAVQRSAIPAALERRDIIALSSTGSGKTFAFLFPIAALCMAAERRCPILPGDGPVAMVLAPARDLARQIHDVLAPLAERCGLRTLLLVGGDRLQPQDAAAAAGTHVVVATPGRLLDFLSKGKIGAASVEVVVLDEADRMLDTRWGFEEEVRALHDFFTFPRQTLLFSATMPPTIKSFATSSLHDPIIIRACGRAGAASLKVEQTIEWCPPTERGERLLMALRRRPPPAIVFAYRSEDVDDICEHLLAHGVAAVAVHGGRDPVDRVNAMAAFRKREKEVLVATDVIAKGLDIADVRHVICWDMPREIEVYVHRIGRTGRNPTGPRGLATAFVHEVSTPAATLRDLAGLLAESRNVVPPELVPYLPAGGGGQCAYCSGLGHTITACPKLAAARAEAGRAAVGAALQTE